MDTPLEVRHIVAAADESEAGRDAIWAAVRIAGHVHARVTVLRVLPFESQGEPAALEQLRCWAESDLPAGERLPPITYTLAYGMPGIEIGRFAERAHAGLLVLGRKRRSRATRLLLGDTADAVARRSRIACLFVPRRIRCPEHLLVAVDGSERGMAVPRAAHRLAGLLGARLDVLTVEPAREDEPVTLAAAIPMARSRRIQSEVRRGLGHDLEVRRGRVAEEILAAADQHDPDVIVLGCHRGGPAGVIEAGSTARHVLHEAECSVLTIPL